MGINIVEMSPTGKRKMIKYNPQSAVSADLKQDDQQPNIPVSNPDKSNKRLESCPRVTLSDSEEEQKEADYMEEQTDQTEEKSQAVEEMQQDLTNMIPFSKINENDVLCGRGAGTNRHIGNQRFRELVQEYQQAYLVAKVLDKSAIAATVVETIASRNPPGRFLRVADGVKIGGKNESNWFQISDRDALDKTSQALRERAPEVRRRLGCLSPKQESTNLSPVVTPSAASSGVASENVSPLNLSRPKISSVQSSIVLLGSSKARGSDSQKTKFSVCDNADVTDNDVLCGRGGVTNCHAGNRRFRHLVKTHQPAYLAAPKLEKAKIAHEIVQIIRDSSPPGRFLQQRSKDGLWHDIGDAKAREKTSQALREKAAEVRSLYSAAASLVDAKECGETSSEHFMRSPVAGEFSRIWPSYPYPSHIQQQHYHQFESAQERDVFNYRDEPYHQERSDIHSPSSLKDDPGARVMVLDVNDVVLGRGYHFSRNSGNARFRSIVQSYDHVYAMSDEHERNMIASTIVGMVRRSVPRGRFLLEDPVEMGVWNEVGDARALYETCRILGSNVVLHPETLPNQAIDTPTASHDDEEQTCPDGVRIHDDDVNEFDVLLGRGAGVNYHSGNRRFRDLVIKYRPGYMKAPKMSKAPIAHALVEEIRNSNPPGRFLMRDPSQDGFWVDVGDVRAREKTSQALREKYTHVLNQPPSTTPKRQHPTAHSPIRFTNRGYFHVNEMSVAQNPSYSSPFYPSERLGYSPPRYYTRPPMPECEFSHYPSSRHGFYASHPDLAEEWNTRVSARPPPPQHRSTYESTDKRRRIL